jgi:hypothetical protein
MTYSILASSLLCGVRRPKQLKNVASRLNNIVNCVVPNKLSAVQERAYEKAWEDNEKEQYTYVSDILDSKRDPLLVGIEARRTVGLH